MRLVLATLLLSLVACRPEGAPEPAWPKSAGHVAPETWEEDGGESLEPRGDTMIEDSNSGDPPGEEIDADLAALIDQAMQEQNETTGSDDQSSSDEMIIVDEDDAPPPPPPPTP